MRFDIRISAKKIMTDTTFVRSQANQGDAPLLRRVSRVGKRHRPSAAFLFCRNKMKSLIWTVDVRGFGAFSRCESAPVRKNLSFAGKM